MSQSSNSNNSNKVLLHPAFVQRILLFASNPFKLYNFSSSPSSSDHHDNDNDKSKSKTQDNQKIREEGKEKEKEEVELIKRHLLYPIMNDVSIIQSGDVTLCPVRAAGQKEFAEELKKYSSQNEKELPASMRHFRGSQRSTAFGETTSHASFTLSRQALDSFIRNGDKKVKLPPQTSVSRILSFAYVCEAWFEAVFEYETLELIFFPKIFRQHKQQKSEDSNDSSFSQSQETAKLLFLFPGTLHSHIIEVFKALPEIALIEETTGNKKKTKQEQPHHQSHQHQIRVYAFLNALTELFIEKSAQVCEKLAVMQINDRRRKRNQYYNQQNNMIHDQNEDNHISTNRNSSNRHIRRILESFTGALSHVLPPKSLQRNTSYASSDKFSIIRKDTKRILESLFFDLECDCAGDDEDKEQDENNKKNNKNVVVARDNLMYIFEKPARKTATAKLDAQGRLPMQFLIEKVSFLQNSKHNSKNDDEDDDDDTKNNLIISPFSSDPVCLDYFHCDREEHEEKLCLALKDGNCEVLSSSSSTTSTKSHETGDFPPFETTVCCCVARNNNNNSNNIFCFLGGNSSQPLRVVDLGGTRKTLWSGSYPHNHEKNANNNNENHQGIFAMSLSPCGRFLATTVLKEVQIWYLPENDHQNDGCFVPPVPLCKKAKDDDDNNNNNDDDDKDNNSCNNKILTHNAWLASCKFLQDDTTNRLYLLSLTVEHELTLWEICHNNYNDSSNKMRFPCKKLKTFQIVDDESKQSWMWNAVMDVSSTKLLHSDNSSASSTLAIIGSNQKKMIVFDVTNWKQLLQTPSPGVEDSVGFNTCCRKLQFVPVPLINQNEGSGTNINNNNNNNNRHFITLTTNNKLDLWKIVQDDKNIGVTHVSSLTACTTETNSSYSNTQCQRRPQPQPECFNFSVSPNLKYITLLYRSSASNNNNNNNTTLQVNRNNDHVTTSSSHKFQTFSLKNLVGEVGQLCSREELVVPVVQDHQQIKGNIKNDFDNNNNKKKEKFLLLNNIDDGLVSKMMTMKMNDSSSSSEQDISSSSASSNQISLFNNFNSQFVNEMIDKDYKDRFPAYVYSSYGSVEGGTKCRPSFMTKHQIIDVRVLVDVETNDNSNSSTKMLHVEDLGGIVYTFGE